MVLSKCICLCHCLCLCLCLCHCSFFGQVMSPHHPDQMSQRSPVSGIAFWRCSINVFVFVIVIVFVFVFVFVIVFFLVRSCFLITLIKCLKGDKSLGSLCCCVFQKVPHLLTHSVSDKVTYWAARAAKNGKCTYAYQWLVDVITECWPNWQPLLSNWILLITDHTLCCQTVSPPMIGVDNSDV